MDPDEWLDVSAGFIRAVNSVLSRSQFEEQLMKMIPKVENTSEHKYDQAKCLSLMTRGYIADNTIIKVRHWGSDVRSLKQRSEVTEVRELAPVGADSRSWYRKINSGTISDSIY